MILHLASIKGDIPPPLKQLATIKENDGNEGKQGKGQSQLTSGT